MIYHELYYYYFSLLPFFLFFLRLLVYLFLFFFIILFLLFIYFFNQSFKFLTQFFNYRFSIYLVLLNQDFILDFEYLLDQIHDDRLLNLIKLLLNLNLCFLLIKLSLSPQLVPLFSFCFLYFMMVLGLIVLFQDLMLNLVLSVLKFIDF